MNYNKIQKAIFTCDVESEQCALNELIVLDKSIKVEKWLTGGVGLINIGSNYLDLIKKIGNSPPIFIRHICPVEVQVDIKNTIEDTDNIQEAVQNLNIEQYLNENDTFTVQTRCLEKINDNDTFCYSNTTIANKIKDILTQQNLQVDVKNSTISISINYDKNKAYIGVSKTGDNISDYIGGQRRFLKTEDMLSRAEFKLLEVFDILKVDCCNLKTALDLGAAPGGWSRVLLKKGFTVTAVDPAMLHESLYENDNVTHVKKLAQDYLDKNMKFDVIVNDMRMDAKLSCKIMNDTVDNLNKDGFSIITLKLPSKGLQKNTTIALNILKEKFDIILARQLFHNRNEVTVVLKVKQCKTL